jgi:hypothetical protein
MVDLLWITKSERMWKEAVVVYFKRLFKNVLGGIEENYEKP